MDIGVRIGRRRRRRRRKRRRRTRRKRRRRRKRRIVVLFDAVQEQGEDILALPEGKRRKYLDFIDILLEAKVSCDH